jgi:hypothetical protein
MCPRTPLLLLVADPFANAATGPLSTLAQALHEGGARMKLYYTTRELSNHVAEMWMLRALGAEILDPGSADTNHAYRNVGPACCECSPLDCSSQDHSSETDC